MINVYRDNDGWLEPTGTWDKGTWIHIEDPTEKEIELVCEELDLPHTFVRSSLDPREVARTDTKRNMHLVIVRAPYDFGAEATVPFRTVPLGMIVTSDNLITICHKPINFVTDLNYNYQDEELPTRRASRMIMALLGVVAEWFLLYLEEIDRRLDGVEERLKDSIENSEMLELLKYEKSLVYIKTGLDWNDKMIEHLQGKEYFAWSKEDQELFEDVQIEYQQGLHMAQTMLEVLGANTDTYASLISNNLNVVMKFMAAVTIILTLPMIVASFYGMNVALPGEDNPGTYMILIVLSLAIALAVAWWFRKRGWLSFSWRRLDAAGEDS